MSLINDALKRAKKAQDQPSAAPTPPPLEFKPLDSAPPSHSRGGMVAVSLGALVIVVAGLLGWQWMARNRPTVPPTSPTPAVAQSPAPAPAPVAAVPKPVEPSVATPAAAAPPQAPANPPALPVNPPAVASVPPPTETASAPAAQAGVTPPTAPEPPKPAPLRLQAIVYSPTHPTAMIGGRTLGVGDKIGDLRLVAIDRETATLVGRGATNILSLAQ